MGRGVNPIRTKGGNTKSRDVGLAGSAKSRISTSPLSIWLPGGMAWHSDQETYTAVLLGTTPMACAHNCVSLTMMASAGSVTSSNATWPSPCTLRTAYVRPLGWCMTSTSLDPCVPSMSVASTVALAGSVMSRMRRPSLPLRYRSVPSMNEPSLPFSLGEATGSRPVKRSGMLLGEDRPSTGPSSPAPGSLDRQPARLANRRSESTKRFIEEATLGRYLSLVGGALKRRPPQDAIRPGRRGGRRAHCRPCLPKRDPLGPSATGRRSRRNTWTGS